MAFEAYHTARCRRDGLPLPNPFGLNDLGHKLGFDKSWHGHAAPRCRLTPTSPHRTERFRPPERQEAMPPTYTPPYPVAGTVPPPSWAGASLLGAVRSAHAAQCLPECRPMDAQVPYPGNRFPAGAIWLIGLGAIFLLFNAGFMHGHLGKALPADPAHRARRLHLRPQDDRLWLRSHRATARPDYRIRLSSAR